MRIISLLNLTLVVIGSWANAGPIAKGKNHKPIKINAETQRREDVESGPLVGPSPGRLVTVSFFLFILSRADPTGRVESALQF